MFQILFGLGVDTWDVTLPSNVLRWLASMLDLVVYQLIVFVYQILFTIADSSIISSEYIRDFNERFQIILGVFMIFKLAVSVLQYVVNPDLMSDKKAGIGNVITRIVTMLAMFMAIIPLNIPADNAPYGSYNYYLNDHGLLFGTMYSLQARVIDNNVLEKLILGDTQIQENKNKGNAVSSDGGSGIDKEASANRLASQILKTFVRINVRADSDGDMSKTANYRCPKEDLNYKSKYGDVYDVYNDEDSSPGDILYYINASCYYGPDLKIGEQEGKYALAYFPIVSTICGALILYVLIDFCIGIAQRAIKLAVLRLIAPIPIISYVDPKSSEKGAFATWTKQLISDFLSLFISLAIIFFSINIVEHIIDKDKTFLSLPIGDGLTLVNAIATVFIIVAVFLFARSAPRYIMDALGIKGTGGLLFRGALGGLGAMLSGGGLSSLASGAWNTRVDQAEAAAQGKAPPPAFSSQSDRIAQMLTGDKNAKGGFIGGMQRSLNDIANNNMSRRQFGIDRNMVGQAKNEMYRLKSAASTAEERYKRFATGQMTDSEIDDVISSDMFSDFVANNQGYRDYLRNHGNKTHFGQLSDDEKRDVLTMALENDWSSKQTAAGKQEAWFNEGTKILEGMNINETLQEKYSSTRSFANNLQNRTERAANAAQTAAQANHTVGNTVRAAGLSAAAAATSVVGSVAGSAGQRRSNRLNRRGPGYEAPANRDYGVSHQHRPGTTDRNDISDIRDGVYDNDRDIFNRDHYR